MRTTEKLEVEEHLGDQPNNSKRNASHIEKKEVLNVFNIQSNTSSPKLRKNLRTGWNWRDSRHVGPMCRSIESVRPMIVVGCSVVPMVLALGPLVFAIFSFVFCFFPYLPVLRSWFVCPRPLYFFFSVVLFSLFSFFFCACLILVSSCLLCVCIVF